MRCQIDMLCGVAMMGTGWDCIKVGGFDCRDIERLCGVQCFPTGIGFFSFLILLVMCGPVLRAEEGAGADGLSDDEASTFNGVPLDLNFDLFDEPEMRPLGRFVVPHPRPPTKRKRYEGEEPLLEVFTGADLTENFFGVYAGGVTSAFGPQANLNGFLLKAVYGQSWYRYQSSYSIPTYENFTPRFEGRAEFFEALAGYEFRFQRSIFKVYGGVVREKRWYDRKGMETQINNYKDRNKFAGGGDIDKVEQELWRKINKDHKDVVIGGKATLEVWHDFDWKHWFSGYVSYSTASEFYVVSGRYGVPVKSLVDFDFLIDGDVGVEVSAFGNEFFDHMRFGIFSRYKQEEGEWFFSFGLNGDVSYLNSKSFKKENVYISAQYLTKLYRSDFAF